MPGPLLKQHSPCQELYKYPSGIYIPKSQDLTSKQIEYNTRKVPYIASGILDDMMIWTRASGFVSVIAKSDSETRLAPAETREETGRRKRQVETSAISKIHHGTWFASSNHVANHQEIASSLIFNLLMTFTRLIYSPSTPGQLTSTYTV